MVAEHELIEIEKLFCKALNIPIKDENEPPSKQAQAMVEVVKGMESRKINSNRFKDHLMQWRILFFFQDLQDKSLPELGKESKKGKVYLHIKLFDFITSILIFDKNTYEQVPVKKGKIINMTPATLSPARRIETSKSNMEKIKTFTGGVTTRNIDEERIDFRFTDKAEFLLKKMKIHFFFSEKDANLERFLKNTEIEIRITDGPSWKKIMYKAT